MPKPPDNQIVPFVHQGEVLTPIRALQIDIRIDPDSLLRAGQAMAAALEAVRRSTAGMAIPIARVVRPTGTIIDQHED